MALALGFRHPNEMYATLSDDEIRDWHAYFEVDPFFNDRFDTLMAMFMHLFWNANCKKEDAEYSLEPFMPFSNLEYNPEEAQAEKLARKAKEVAAMFSFNEKMKMAQEQLREAKSKTDG